ncbi:hypothetical protein D5F01_LYC15569 [Larimichthys crocea]|uniref:Polyamine-modulated factor 1 n=1 Tax=Larimichthys crocea TaxID=215358 RepID=A0A6G0I398_LARCR|nr:hypothetical protein D5F01_LYC15569 [Larimichthys crocea]
MEQSKVATQKESVNNTSVKDNTGEQTNEAKGDVSSKPGSVTKPSEETEARYNRLKLFDKVMQKSLEKFIDHASFNRFASTFRPLYKKNPQRMENIHKQFIEELRRTVQDDISRLIEEGRLDFKLNELDKLERAAKNNPNNAWRPSGVPRAGLLQLFDAILSKAGGLHETGAEKDSSRERCPSTEGSGW